jgi:hypothetical protein
MILSDKEDASNPFWSAWRRLSRAEKHTADLVLAADTYFRSKPYTIVQVVNPSEDYVFHKLRMHAVPDILTDLAFDAVSNLRAGLDSAAYVIALAHAPERANSAYFPVSDTAHQLNTDLTKRYVHTYPAEVRALFQRIQPYEGGEGQFLWKLNRVRRQAEHRLLVKCRTNASFSLVGASVGPGGEAQFFSYVEGEEDDLVFAISPIGTHLEYEVEASPFITFGNDVDVMAGYPIGQFLEVVLKKVGFAIASLQAEARGLGLV